MCFFFNFLYVFYVFTSVKLVNCITCFSIGFSWQPCISTILAAEKFLAPAMVKCVMGFSTQSSTKVATLSRRSHYKFAVSVCPYTLFITWVSAGLNYIITEFNLNIFFFPPSCISPYMEYLREGYSRSPKVLRERIAILSPSALTVTLQILP